MPQTYEELSKEDLIRIMVRRDAERKFGLVWERNEIERENALTGEVVFAVPEAELSCGAAPWDNLVIEGDNYDALKYLRMTHKGRVKLILIDPPYNTGNKDFLYNDHYINRDDKYRHSTWLEFLYQRLSLARDLLTEDGVLLVTINDENRSKLELLLDEVMPGMRRGSFVWRTRQGSNADQECFLSPDHEHVLIYSGPAFRFKGVEKSYEMYSNPDNDPRGDWRPDNLTMGFSFTERPNLYYPLTDPKTGIVYPPNPDRVWIYATEERLKPGQRVQARTMEEFIERGQILFPVEQRVETWGTLEELLSAIDRGDVPKAGKGQLLRRDLPDLKFWVGKPVGFGRPAFKRYKADLRNDTQPISSWVTPKAESDDAGSENTIVSGTNQEGTTVLTAILGRRAFNYPKPLSLIKGLVDQATAPDQNDIVLDFFAGSGTTAHAVLDLNAEDGGNRRFIMVSSTEAAPDAPERNICRDILRERIRRVGEGHAGRGGLQVGGFAYLKLRKMTHGKVGLSLRDPEVWTAIQLREGFPVAGPGAGRPIQTAGSADKLVVYIPRIREDSVEALSAAVRSHANCIVYTWQPAMIRDRVDASGITVIKVPNCFLPKGGAGI